MKAAALTLALLGLAACSRPLMGEDSIDLAHAETRRIDGDEARGLIDEGAVLLDVRSSAEFQLGHIDGAVNIPVGQVAERAAELGPPGTTVVVYCLSGHRSARAYADLEDAGYDVWDLGSMQYW